MPSHTRFLPYLKWTILVVLLFVAALAGTTTRAATTETVTYSYDDTYQLTEAAYANSAVTVSYGYDDAGNRDYKTTASADTDPPSSAISAPLEGALFYATSYTVTGTASDTGGSVIYVVEFSDDGTNWYPATDTSTDGSWSTWSYEWAIPAEGEYTLYSRATDSVSNQEDPGQGVTVNVYSVPVPVMAAAPNPAACGQSVGFDASGSYHTSSSRSIALYEWDFENDGTFDSQGVTSSHGYAAFGSYTAVLRLTDDDSPPRTATASVTIDVNLGNNKPTPVPGGPYEVNFGYDVELDGSGSTDPDEACGDSIDFYEWDIDNDGSYDYFGSAPVVPWSTLSGFPMPDIENPVTLKVTDTFYAYTTATTTLTILDHCANGVQDADEEGVDCGGVDCGPCEHCNNCVEDFDETDVDCGGIDCASCFTAYSTIWKAQEGTFRPNMGLAVCKDGDGNVCIAGSTKGDHYATNAGYEDIFIAKYDADGTLLWGDQFGTGKPDIAYGITADGDGNFYIAGATKGSLDGNTQIGGWDFFVSKYTPDGVRVWTEQYGTSVLDEAYAVAVDGAGNVYLTGKSYGNLDGISNSGGYDIIVVKYGFVSDTEVVKEWSWMTGSNGDDSSESIAFDDTNGYLYVAGVTRGPILGMTHERYEDVFVIRFDTDGNVLWSDEFGTINRETAYGVCVGSDGNFYLAGETNGVLDGSNSGDYDLFVARYDVNGNRLWTRQVGSTNFDTAYSVAVNDAGNGVYAVGVTSTLTGGPIVYTIDKDCFVVKYDPDGNNLWTKQIGTSERDEAHCVTVSGCSDVFVTGFTMGSLGGANAGGEDVFLLKLAP